MNADLDKQPPEPIAGTLLEALISSAVDAIIVIDHRGTIRLFSRSAERLFGYLGSEVVGKNVNVLMPEPYRSEHDGYISNYHATGRRRIIGIGREVKIRTRDGQELPVDLAVGEARIDDETLYVGIIRDLRQRRHLEVMLEQERRRAERVFDLVEVVIVGIDQAGRVLIANRKGHELLGVEPGVIGTPWLERVHPEDRETVDRLIAEVFDSPPAAPRSAEYRVGADPDLDHLFAWQHQFVPSSETGDPDLLLCTGIDMTETHRMSQLLRRNEEQLRLTFEQAPVGIARLDLKGQLVEINTTLSQFLQCQPQALVGLPFQRLLDERDLGRFEVLLAGLADDPAGGQAMSCGLGFEATTIKARLFIGAIRDPEGQPINLLVQVEDRSRQAAAETEIDHLRARLAHVQRLSVMGEMAAGIAHEINQPLGAIATFSDGARRMLAGEPPKLDEVNYALDQIGAQARRAGDVVRRMRAMSKGQTQSRQSVDLNQVIRDLVGLAELESRNLGAPLKLDLQDDLPPGLADEVQIQQVILNLIRNSLEALATRSQARQGVTISTRTDNERIVVCVADHGIGVSEEFTRKVFEPFYSSKPSGTGMGLSICSTIVRAHEGRLWHEPNPGGGSRFLFELPLAGR